MTDQPDALPTFVTPTLDELVAMVDVMAVAGLIATQGARAAIRASTIDIVAMARRLTALSALADLTFDMLAAADAVQAERNLDTRKGLQRQFKARVNGVGVSLEALGYGQEQPTTPQQKETTDGASQN